MAVTSSRTGKFSWGRTILYALAIACVAMVVHFLLKYYYSFMKLGENTWGRFAFTWKAEHAYKSLVKPYKKLGKNSWNEKDAELSRFVEFAQGDDGMLDDFFPEHFPRHPQSSYYTVSYGWNDEVFLRLRKYVSKKTLEESKRMREKYEKYERGKAEKKKVVAPKLFMDLPSFVLKDDDFGGDSALKESVGRVTARLGLLLNYLWSLSDEKDKILDDTDAESNRIVELTYDVMKEMDYEHGYLKGGKTVRETLTRRHVLDWWRNLGNVKSTPYESFVYTRMFFLFYFHTSSVEPADVTEKKNKKIVTRKESAEEQLVSRHADFARLMVRAFKSPKACGRYSALQKFYLPKLAEDEKMAIGEERVKKYLELVGVEQ